MRFTVGVVQLHEFKDAFGEVVLQHLDVGFRVRQAEAWDAGLDAVLLQHNVTQARATPARTLQCKTAIAERPNWS